MIHKYKNAVAVFIGFQTIFTWFYIFTIQRDISSDSVNFHFNMSNKMEYNVLVPKMKNVKPTNIRKQTTPASSNSSHMSKGDCNEIELPVELLQVDTWSPIDKDGAVYVFAAYIVEQNGRVEALGASINPAPEVFCQYWHIADDNITLIISVHTAVVRWLPENHGRKYTGAIFECPASVLHVRYVSLTTSKCDIPLNLLQLTNAILPNRYQRIFTVCLKPLHFNYNEIFELIEWIELNKILGADKFVIYVFSISNNTAKVLDYYVKQGIVELVRWNLPMKSYTWPKTNDPIEIHSNGMVLSIQDCLMRNKAHSEFIVNIDVDEFIIPRSEHKITWHDMMKQLSSVCDTYIFRNVFFRKDWNSTSDSIDFHGNDLAKKYNLVTLQKILREKQIFDAKIRSKYFTKTTKTDKVLMVHDVQGGKTQTVPVTIGMLHHYRNWENPNKPLTRIRDDLIVTKYGDKLIENIQITWSKQGNVKSDTNM